MTSWYLLQNNPKGGAFCASGLIKSIKSEDFNEICWFLTPENPGDHRLKKNFLSNYKSFKNLKNSILGMTLSVERVSTGLHATYRDEIASIEDLLVEFHDILTRHRLYQQQSYRQYTHSRGRTRGRQKANNLQIRLILSKPLLTKVKRDSSVHYQNQFRNRNFCLQKTSPRTQSAFSSFMC